jgi:hypothetical protein
MVVRFSWRNAAITLFLFMLIVSFFGFKVAEADAQSKPPRFYRDAATIIEGTQLVVIEDTRHNTVCYIAIRAGYIGVDKMQCILKPAILANSRRFSNNYPK